MAETTVLIIPTKANGWKNKFHENCCNSSINVLCNEKKMFGMPLLFYLDVSKDGHEMRHSSAEGVVTEPTSMSFTHFSATSEPLSWLVRSHIKV